MPYTYGPRHRIPIDLHVYYINKQGQDIHRIYKAKILQGYCVTIRGIKITHYTLLYDTKYHGVKLLKLRAFRIDDENFLSKQITRASVQDIIKQKFIPIQANLRHLIQK